MAKFYGEIGYGELVESPPGSGVMTDQITERTFIGDVIDDSRRLQDAGDQLNREITVENLISVIADALLLKHYFAIRYIKWMGVTWTVDTVRVQAPRLILRLGEVYNGPTAVGAPSSP